MAWRIEEHTADLIIAAKGRTAEATLAEAALALTSVLSAVDSPRALPADEERHLTVEAPDELALVVAFLAELVWLHDSDDLLWTGGGVTLSRTADGLHRLEAVGNFARHDGARHGRGVEVKAVTYHDLVFGREGDRWRLRVLLDI